MILIVCGCKYQKNGSVLVTLVYVYHLKDMLMLFLKITVVIAILLLKGVGHNIYKIGKTM